MPKTTHPSDKRTQSLRAETATHHSTSMEQRRHRTTLSPSRSMLVPYADRHLAVAPPVSSASPISIPPGWGVEQVPRRDGSHTDKYYYEPGSGRKFRSIKEVHRYLNGEDSTPSPSRTTRRRPLLFARSSGCRRMIVSDGKLWRLNNELSSNQLAMVASARPARSAPYILPDGWIVEEVPRRFDDCSDKYYYEPETGRKFRSLVAVERYLAELEENENENAPLSKTLEEIMENRPLAKVFKREHHTKSSSPRKKNSSHENTQASSFIGPPMKVNWVLASPQGNVFNPFIAEALVPDAVKQQWSNRFMLFMKNGSNNLQGAKA